jgi:hypothetical protein
MAPLPTLGIHDIEPVSFEITSDRYSERFRDLVSEALLEIVGHERRYGAWTVMLRSELDVLYVVMTRPDDTRQEWAFDLSGARRSADVADQLRRRLRTGNGRP